MRDTSSTSGQATVYVWREESENPPAYPHPHSQAWEPLPAYGADPEQPLPYTLMTPVDKWMEHTVSISVGITTTDFLFRESKVKRWPGKELAMWDKSASNYKRVLPESRSIVPAGALYRLYPEFSRLNGSNTEV